MKKFILLIATSLITLSAVAQTPVPPLAESSDSDLQARVKASIEFPLSEKWSLTWGEQLRLKNSLGDVDKILSSLTLDYKPLKFLETGVEYAFVNERKGADDYRIKHRVNLSVTGKLSLGRFDLSLRERVRFVIRSYHTNKFETPNPFAILQSRFKVAYNTPTRWKPYAYVELHNTLNTPEATMNNRKDLLRRDVYINCVRLVLGSELKLGDKHKMDLHYMVNFNRSNKLSYAKDSGDLEKWAIERVCAHVICVEYKFKL